MENVHRLPPEVWALIAEELLKIGSDDLENLANSSEFFQDVLASLRTTYLFEKVFPLVASSVWKKEGLEGLPVSEVLQLRGVCKHWNAVIDKLVLEKLQYFYEETNDEGTNDEEVASIGSAFKSVVNHVFTHLMDVESGINECIHNFLRHFESSHRGQQLGDRNPFIWGNIYVETCHKKDEHEEEYQRYLEGVSTMLSKYGSHINTFALYCDGDEFSEPENTPVYQKWFSYMPNLKELSLLSNLNNWWENENTLIPGWEFPKFKRLEKLKTDDLPVTLFNPLILQNNHVSTLIVDSVLDDYDFFTFPLPNLKILKMGYIADEHLEQLVRSQERWALENLSIELANESVGCEALFPIIQDKFSSTLCSLEILMLFAEQEDEGPHWLGFKNLRLRLPKLTKIHLVLKGNKVCLDFLLGMKHNLEEISVNISYKLPLVLKRTMTSGTIVQFMGFEGKMLESNVWMLFKKLRKIKVRAEWEWEGRGWKTRVYSREEWMVNNEYI